MIKKYKNEIIVFSLAFLVRFIYAVAMQVMFGDHVFISYSDAATYLQEAKNLVTHHTLSQVVVSPFLVPDPLRTPGYPLFLALFVWLKSPLFFIAVAQDALAGLMAVMIYRLGIKIFESRPVGIIASIIFSIEPMSIYWNNLLMSDNLASFLFILSTYLFAYKKYYSSVFVISLATLTRPINLYFFPLLLLMYLYENGGRTFHGIFLAGNRLALWRNALLFCLLFFITLFPWMLRNKIQFDTWQLSSAGWFIMCFFDASKFAEIQHVTPYWPPMDHVFSYSGPYRDVLYYYEFFNVPLFKKCVLDPIYHYPVDYFKFHVISAIKGFDNHDYGYIMDYVLRAKLPQFNRAIGAALVAVGQGIWLIAYGLIIFGFFMRGKRAWLLFFASFYLVNNFLLGYISNTSAVGRYQLPFFAIMMLSASYGLVCLYECAKNRWFARAAA